MVLYRITLVLLAKEFGVADPGLLSPFYSDNVAFDGSERRSAQLLKLLMETRPDRGVFTQSVQVTLHIGKTGA